MAEDGAEDAPGHGFRRSADGDGVDHLPFCAVCAGLRLRLVALDPVFHHGADAAFPNGALEFGGFTRTGTRFVVLSRAVVAPGVLVIGLFDAGFYRFEVVEPVFALVSCVVDFAFTPLADEAERLSAVALVWVALVGTLVLSVVSVPTRTRLFQRLSTAVRCDVASSLALNARNWSELCVFIVLF